MSYILEALKKSEQERGTGNIPSVQTVHSHSLLYRKEKPVRWPYILIAAVILNIAAIGYFIYMQTSSSAMSQAHQTKKSTDPSAITAPVPAVAIQPEQKIFNNQPTTETMVTKYQQVPRQADKGSAKTQHTEKLTHTKITTQQPLQPTANETKTSPLIPVEKAGSTTTSTPTIIEQQDLPKSIQRELPTLTISSHVYSNNPQQRSMVINNQLYEEGDYIMDGLMLYKITPDGAIFKYKDLLFHNGVVTSWQ